MSDADLAALAGVYRRNLLHDVVPFWERHGVDRDCGGFFTLLDRCGARYGDDKPIWLQGRAAWMFATLYRRVEARPQWLDLARHGCAFLDRHAFDERGKMYFCVARDGRPLRMRRYVFSEVFGVLAYAGLAAATAEDAPRRRAVEVYRSMLRHLRTPGLIPPKTDPGTRPMKSLSPLMCILNVAGAMREIDPAGPYEADIDASIEEILRDFVRVDQRCVLEHVGPRGEVVEGPDGRVMNPGHAIECAWFILEVARRRSDPALARRALEVIDISLERGWDTEHGGLLYFVDVEGRPATQLEHDMKLWWPHNEALIALTMACAETPDPRYRAWLRRVHDWTFARFPDPEFGEWYGYLHRDGTVSTPIKGGMWKGFFHVPRCLLMCKAALEQLGGSAVGTDRAGAGHVA